MACRGRGREAGDTTRSSSTTVAASTGASLASNARDTGSDCGLVRVMAHPDPGVLVQAYVQRDGAGDFVQRAAWLDTALECPHRLPAPGAFDVVAFRSVAPLYQADSSARFALQSAQLGRVTPGAGGGDYAEHWDTKVDTVTAVRTAFGWRLVTPPPPVSVLAAEILSTSTRFQLKAAARTALAKEWAQAISGN